MMRLTLVSRARQLATVCAVVAAGLASTQVRSDEKAAIRSAGRRLQQPSSTSRSSTSSLRDHPLDAVLEYAYDVLQHIDEHVYDYTCVLVKRERVSGELTRYQHLRAKIRHAQTRNQRDEIPFSVYLRFLSPTKFRGREVLYIQGQRNNDILVRRGGAHLPNMTLQLSPLGRLAMAGNRYPITEIGFENLVKKVVEVMEEESAYDECNVQFFKNSKLNGRLCTHIEVTHPVRRDHFRYHHAKMLIDKELKVPIYFASYDWPGSADGEPELLEEYAYTDMRINVGLNDRDFDRTNPSYEFLNLGGLPEQ